MDNHRIHCTKTSKSIVAEEIIENTDTIVDNYINKKTDIEESKNEADMPRYGYQEYIKSIRNRFMVSLGNVPDELEEIQDRLYPVPKTQALIIDIFDRSIENCKLP